jgi:hypothetical protein
VSSIKWERAAADLTGSDAVRGGMPAPVSSLDGLIELSRFWGRGFNPALNAPVNRCIRTIAEAVCLGHPAGNDLLPAAQHQDHTHDHLHIKHVRAPARTRLASTESDSAPVAAGPTGT